MYIKLCKNGRNRIVDSNNTLVINDLTKDGYTVVCDETGKPKTYDMNRYENKVAVEDKTVADTLAKLDEPTDTDKKELEV